MGLIDRAVNAGGEDAPVDPQPALRDEPAAQRFALSRRTLAQQGLYTPGRENGALALELRVMKRRLMRRLGYLRRGAADRLRSQQGRRRNIVLVTSTRAGEGKTFTAISLALSFAAEEEIETVVIDADTPRPKVRAHLGLAAGPGLVDALRDPRLRPSQITHRADDLPFSVIGEGAPVERADALFGSADAQRFFTGLSARNRERIVFVDAPPVLSTTEALVLARYVDEVIFVVEADATPEPAVSAALDELLDVNPNVSLVLNRCLFAGGGTHYGSYERYDRQPRDAAPNADPAGEGE
ncbi:MAG: hypothetical protein AAGC56_09390 [Pseudomonadota bacterium]